MTMRLAAFASCAFVSLLVLPSSAAHAQIAGARYCSSDVYNDAIPVQGADPVQRMHPLLARSRYADAVRNEQWDLALRGLRDDAMRAFVAANVSPVHRQRFLDQLDSVLSAIPRLPSPTSTTRASFIVDSLMPARFRPRPAISEYELFRGAQTIGMGELSAEQMKALCWSAMSVDVVLFRLSTPLELQTLARLARLNTAWANYRSYGYTRQPLELVLAPGSVHDSLPPRAQWLVAHLSLGAEVHGRVRDSLMSNSATVLEVGRLWYRGNYTQYAGLSAILGAAPGRAIGYGAMLHVARGLRSGMLFRRSGGITTRSFVVSTDLYGLLDRSKRSVDEGTAIARGRVVLPSRDGR